jgi:hypothetical protein
MSLKIKTKTRLDHIETARTQASPIAVTDDLPERLPVIGDEVSVLHAWFGDILDELWGLDT